MHKGHGLCVWTACMPQRTLAYVLKSSPIHQPYYLLCLPTIASIAAPRSATPDWQHLDIRSLEAIVVSQPGIESLLALRGEDAKAVVNLLDQVTSLTSFLPYANLLASLGTGHTQPRRAPRKEIQVHPTQTLQHMWHPPYIAYPS